MQPCLGPDQLRLAASNRPEHALPVYGMLVTPQVKNQYCARDATGQAETGEMEQHAHEHEWLVGRGHRTDGRRLETAETSVVALITQRRPVTGQAGRGSRVRRSRRSPSR